MTIEEQLDQLADRLEPTEYQNGEEIIVPDDGQDLEAFQADVRRLRRYAAEGRFQIRRERQENYSGNRHIVSVHIHMGPEGVAWRNSLR